MIKKLRVTCAAVIYLVCATVCAQSESRSNLGIIQVQAQLSNSIESSDAASASVISDEVLTNLPLLRPGDVLDQVPGMVVTQHSGDGKANQYFLRGFNLDHGTDFATTIQGVPVNLPTNAHGQGYTDLNYLIPELVDHIDYRKGPYFANTGDFSSAGSADIYYRSSLDQNIANLTFGAFGYRRALFAGSTFLKPAADPNAVQSGPVLLGAVEIQRANGPWSTPEGLQKTNALLRLTDGTRDRGWSVDVAYYSANWTSTDQVPLSLIEDGSLSRYSALDPTDGGNTERALLATEWHQRDSTGYTKVNAFLQHYSLNLWSNFTYYENDPVNGDQFHQSENRNFMGAGLVRGWHHSFFGHDSTTEIGLQTRYDSIRVGLANTVGRAIVSTVSDDQVNQSITGLYLQNTTGWTPWLRSVVGTRVDYTSMGLTADALASNTGHASAATVSPKLSLIFGPWKKTEVFFNIGQGIHSNDARGVIYKTDPTTGLPASQVPALVKTFGQELGVRTEFFDGLKSSVALWQLDSGSELVYDADSGTTEPNDASHRYGLEWNNELTVNRWLKLHADLALTRASYNVDNANGQSGSLIPNAPPAVAQITAVFGKYGPWTGSVQYRYIGAYPLTQDGALMAPSTNLTNLRLHYEIDSNTAIALDVLNVFNREYYDIAYAQDYRVSPASPLVPSGITVHPGEPRQLRLTLMIKG